ncbi:MAG: formate dehydrogenase accessory sulfurtransferase FdhD [Azonexaceae bacterium]|uniref:formate dehydrogenase accessory sulfurtransferase FdhD n=1 Tax=Azonexus sp. R2A61 TaxID=2744443 RepID=UPI001F35B051|nr:formate dehydrogenase accessory sulfurtransferase FdhD [Azonexus sp. R2A61]MCE1240957.1 formate dehydrogenase accessory sulfurtransferase FdhD [Azonexaceae bacterium]
MKPQIRPAAQVDPDDVLPTTVLADVHRLSGEFWSTASDELIEEVPVALVYNGISHAVMLASPSDLEDFALGFSLSEGILARPGELYDIEVKPGCDGISIEMEIASERFVGLKDRRRQLTGRTGCGLCGVESLAGVTAMPDKTLHAGEPLTVAAIHEALRQLPHWQAMRERCGSAHAAAWADAAGNIRCVREDVGRHNALDKLVGALARSGDAGDGFVLVTSRASYEMVQKTASAGLPALVAVSAPTALAVRQAQAAGLLLVGFARAHGMVVYAGAERIVDAGGVLAPPTLM